MRLKHLIACGLCALCILCTPTAVFADHPMPHDAVGEEVSRADNTDQDGAHTRFYLYIESPAEIGELPRTGEQGPHPGALAAGAVVCGAGALLTSRIARGPRP